LPEDITFLEIYEAIEGSIEITSCPLDKQICPFDKCILNNVTNKMAIKFRDHLKEQTLDKYI
jgi:DNA-binding IscR family transcriptional regulator